MKAILLTTISILALTAGYSQTNAKTANAEREANRKLDSMISSVQAKVKQTTDTVKRKNEVLKKKF